MATLESTRATLRDAQPGLQERYQVECLGVFGSWVRGEQRTGSDVDILVDFVPGSMIGFFRYMELENELSGLLGLKVDLVTRGALKPRIGRRVLSELVPV